MAKKKRGDSNKSKSIKTPVASILSQVQCPFSTTNDRSAVDFFSYILLMRESFSRVFFFFFEGLNSRDFFDSVFKTDGIDQTPITDN